MYTVTNITTSRQVTPYGIFQAGEWLTFEEAPVGSPEDRPLKYFNESPYFTVTSGSAPGTTPDKGTANGGQTGPTPADLYLAKAANLSDLTDLVQARINLGVSQLNLGVVSVESANRALTDYDNGKTLVCTLSPVFTVGNLISGFGCAFRGTVSFTGTATITDTRVSGAAYPWCALVATGVNTYDAVGGKA